jgi:hypothetical protein
MPSERLYLVRIWIALRRMANPVGDRGRERMYYFRKTSEKRRASPDDLSRWAGDRGAIGAF